MRSGCAERLNVKELNGWIEAVECLDFENWRWTAQKQRGETDVDNTSEPSFNHEHTSIGYWNVIERRNKFYLLCR